MIASARKRCSGCGHDKPLTDYYRSKRYGDGRQVWCKACSRKATDRYQQRVGRSVLQRSVKYGLTPDEVRAMMRIPVCQSCGSSFTDSYSRKFDHCHDRGHFRGVLCHACNMSCMGLADAAISRLRSCIDYLQRDLERRSE